MTVHPLKNRLASLGTHGVLAAASVLLATPFVWLACASVKRNEDFFGSLFLPAGSGLLGVAWERLTGAHFAQLFGELGLGRALLVSTFLASVTAVLATLFSAMGGFALSRLEFPGRRWIGRIVLAALVIPAPLLLAPTFQVLYQTRLLDTMAGLILPAIAPAFGLYLFRQAAQSSVPRELLEAGRIDGCGDVRSFFSIGLPLMMPMVAAFLMITFLGTWNNYISPQVFFQTPEKFPLAVSVAQLRGAYYQDYGLLMAGTLVSVVPVLLLFLLLQREFVSGLTSGAVKG